MRIVLATYGSRGDVQPMLALTLTFKAMGHDALLAGPPEKMAWAARLNCPYFPLGSNLTSFIDKLRKVYSLTTLKHTIPFLKREVNIQFEQLPQIASKADLLIGSSLVFALPSIADHLKIPYRYLAFTPQLLPSSNHPHPIFSGQNYPKWFNFMSWKFINFFDGVVIRDLVNRYRRQLGLAVVKDSIKYLLGNYVIVASDPAISKVPEDIKKCAFTQTAYMHLKQPGRSLIELERFLQKGPTPIYAGFGSMPRLDQMDSVATIVNAARSSGQRMVIGKFWNESSLFEGCEDIFFIGKYPHLDLFERMALIIHHGGAGTTAAAAFCGRPQIIVPHLLDQYYWGDRIYHCRLGPKPIKRSRLNSRKLSLAINKCLSDGHIQKKAAQVSKMIQRIDGAKRTAEVFLGSFGS